MNIHAMEKDLGELLVKIPKLEERKQELVKLINLHYNPPLALAPDVPKIMVPEPAKKPDRNMVSHYRSPKEWELDIMLVLDQKKRPMATVEIAKALKCSPTCIWAAKKRGMENVAWMGVQHTLRYYLKEWQEDPIMREKFSLPAPEKKD